MVRSFVTMSTTWSWLCERTNHGKVNVSWRCGIGSVVADPKWPNAVLLSFSFDPTVICIGAFLQKGPCFYIDNSGSKFAT